jgi:hypothetical protein
MGSADGSSIILHVDAGPPWSQQVKATYTSSRGLEITRNPGSFGSVVGSEAPNLSKAVLEAKFDRDQLVGDEIRPHYATVGSSADLATGTIEVYSKVHHARSIVSGFFEDTVTFVNPNAVIVPIYLLWSVDGTNGGYAEGHLSFGASGLFFHDAELGRINAYGEGWPSSPQISRSGEHGAYFVATHNLAPGSNDVGIRMQMFLGCESGRNVDSMCDFQPSIRFDLGNNGVTFTSGSGVLLSAVVPEPGTFGLSLMSVALTALIILRRTRTHP